MKIPKLIPALMAIAAAILILSSCSKDNSPSNTIINGTPDGSWKVSYYFDSGDETSNFSAYTFTFGSNGQVTAIKNGTTYTGTWSQGSRFNIDFGADPVLSDLTDDWVIEEKTTNSIKLKDDNTTNNEVLQFTKL